MFYSYSCGNIICSFLDNNLLLGTRQGHLLMYSLSQTNGNQKYELQLLQYCKNFSKKPIQQIEVIPGNYFCTFYQLL